MAVYNPFLSLGRTTSPRSLSRISCPMKQTFVCSLFFVCCVLAGLRVEAEDLQLPKWIAIATPPNQSGKFSTRVDLDEPTISCRMKFAADFARASVMINGTKVLAVEPYCQLQSVDVTQWIKMGFNDLQIDAQRVPGPSAVAISFEFQLNSGRIVRSTSDETWGAEVVGTVQAEFWGSGRRDISLSPTENYEQWQQSKGQDGHAVQPKFWTTPGFEVQLLHTASTEEGSWISLTFDPNGRAIISREDQGLLRMTLDQSHKTVERVESIDVDLKECRGLVYVDGLLYANANNSKGLYRLSIDDAGHAEDLTLVRGFSGSVGHGRNDLTIDNGWLYQIHGDSVDLPSEDVTDLTSPLRHWSGDSSQREGHLLRMHLITSRWEIICGGLRNPYGIAAHPGGDLFTFDADNEFDMGTPWYRPTRVIATTPGGDVGYRTAEKKLPPRFHDQPENLPPVLTLGRSSPTAVLCDPEFAFPRPYRNALFLLDWTYGRVIAVHLAPRGASWRAQAELFLQGRPLNVTDVARGPNNDMYVITGGRKTQSSLYRVAQKREVDQFASNIATLGGAHEQEAIVFSHAQIATRKALELVSRDRDEGELQWILQHLPDADPAIRQAARIALERLPVERWSGVVQAADNDLIWLYGSLAHAQAMKQTEVPGVLGRWLKFDPSTFGLSERIVWVRLCELFLHTDERAVQAREGEVIRKLVAVWPNTVTLHVTTEGTTIELRHRLAQLLGLLDSTEGLSLVSKDLLSSSLQEDQIAGLLAIRHVKKGWTTALRRLQFEVFRDSPKMVGGEGLPKFIESIQADSLNSLSNSERLAIADVLEPQNDANVDSVQVRSHVRNWKIGDLDEYASNSIVEGDRERGAKIYRDASCVRCHRIGNQGKSVGPDLTFVGRRFGPKDLLESILTPSRSVAENYRLDVVMTRSGSVHTGQILIEGDYRSENIKIQTDPFRSDSIIEIDKREIEEHRQSERSHMPDGLLDGFDREEIRDLIAYLQNPI